MLKREIGLRGYVGEAIVEYWLSKIKYKKSKGYTIASQIIPTNIPKKGGGYLNFGVIKNKIVEAVYEVKSQDYILDRGFGINKALREVWNNKHYIKSFITQNGKIYNSVS